MCKINRVFYKDDVELMNKIETLSLMRIEKYVKKLQTMVVTSWY